MLKEGIVEKNDVDFGYCLVRIFDKHTHNKTELPTTDLQKAKILYNAESNIDQESYFRTFQNGTHVILDFLDDEEQHPIILGSVVKTVESLPDFTQGFSDSNGEHPSSDYLSESTISRLARNENISSTIVQTKIADRETGISCVSESFDEPANQYNTVYPKNRVLQTSKHIIEIDDSDNAERINIYHSSGSFIEFNPDGTILEKCKGEKFLSVSDDFNIVVHGNCNLTSDGNVNVDGTNINLNGDADNLIAFTDMQIAFNLMRTELNAAILVLNSLITFYNGHTHGDPTPTTPTTTSAFLQSVPAVASIADMTPALVSTVFVP